ncbi:MAG: polysaccharide deacetylase family protein [Armatimonadetes bacterium]|nr:polysaccharide deacetylase family protein [Armatimonadota bacterium]
MLVSTAIAACTYLSSLQTAMKVPVMFAGRTVLNKPAMTEKVVALTFDDGPSPFTTPTVLDSLKKHHAKATFFLVGQMIHRREYLLRRMMAEGHVIGNHSWSHPYHPDPAKAKDEVRRTNQAIHQVTGFYPAVFRPPGGIMDSWTARLAKAQGLPSVIWTGSSADTATTSSAVVYRNVVAAAHPGAIILMHDVKSHTAAAVPAILATLEKKGYRFVTVPEMLRIWQAAKKKAADQQVAAKVPSTGSTKS